MLFTLAFVGACLPLMIGATMAFRDSENVWAGKSVERIALFGLLAASAIGVAVGARFYPHYYIQLVPPLALLAAPHYARLWSERTKLPHWLWRVAASYAWLAFMVVAFSISHWLGLAARRQPSEAGRYLFAHSKPQDRVFIWGQAPKIYLHARRRP